MNKLNDNLDIFYLPPSNFAVTSSVAATFGICYVNTSVVHRLLTPPQELIAFDV